MAASNATGALAQGTINLRVKTIDDMTFNLAVPGDLPVSSFKERIEVYPDESVDRLAWFS